MFIDYCPNTQNILRDGLAGASHRRRFGAAASARAVCSECSTARGYGCSNNIFWVSNINIYKNI